MNFFDRLSLCFGYFLIVFLIIFFICFSFSAFGSIIFNGYIDSYDVVAVYYVFDDDNVYRVDSLGFYDSVSLSHADVRYDPDCDSYSYVLYCKSRFKYSWMDFLFLHKTFYLYTDTLE